MTQRIFAEENSIAVDADDVLAAHVEEFVKFSNTKYGTHLTIEDYSDHWADLWHCSEEEIERRAREFQIPETIANLELKAEAQNAMLALSRKYSLYVVTARPRHTIDSTYVWIDRHFPGFFKGVHFVPIWEPNSTVTKAQICQEIGARYLIDDLPRHCNTAAEGGIEAVLFGDYCWNRNEFLFPGVTRCKDWEAVLRYFGC